MNDKHAKIDCAIAGFRIWLTEGRSQPYTVTRISPNARHRGWAATNQTLNFHETLEDAQAAVLYASRFPSRPQRLRIVGI